MDGAVASQQGNCAEFKHQIPHSCKKDPVIVDLMPEALADNRSEDCCRGGILEAWAINPSKSFSSFEIKVGNLEVNSSGYKPLNITLLAPGPGYTCSPMVDVDPSVSLVIGGRREIQVFMNLTVTIELSQLSSQELNNRLKDSEYITLQSLTETGSPTQINVETFAKFLHVHLMAVVIGSITNAALFRYLLHGLRLLHSLHDHASRQTKFEKVSTSMKDPCHDVFGISKEKKDPRDVKGNRDLLDALPAKRKLEDGGYLSDDGPEKERSGTKMGKQQLDVLNKLDVAKTQWYHVTAVIIAGMGFFTDAYDLFCISLVTKLLGRIYYHVDGSSKPGSLPPNVSAAVNGVAFCGTLSGQLFFGWLGDKLGRKKVYGMTLLCMVICSIGSGLSFGRDPKTVMATLCFFRFWLGFGIGGDYPLSATIMSEYANKKTRGAFIAAVFAMQGFGILGGGVFAIICASAFQSAFKAPAYEINAITSTVPQADYLWRIVLMVGAIPAALTYYWRMKMPETARYTALVAKNAKQAAADMSKVLQVDIEAEPQKIEPIGEKSSNSFGLFSKEFARRHGKHLLGTTTTWFLLDIAFYSQNLFQKDIFSAVGWLPPAKTMNAIEEVYHIARAQTLIAICSTVPGYWFTVFLIDRIGRFYIQMMGFFFMTVFMFALAIPYNHWTLKENRVGFVAMYSFTFFFSNFGPNATTFVVPAEIFPARFRSTCHGISAAAGKLGAMVGAFGFLYLAQNQDKAKTDAGYPAGIGVKNSLIVLGFINLLGLLFTFLVPESKGKSLEEMSGENEEQDDTGVESERATSTV